MPTTTFMSLNLPEPGVTLGTTWATSLNAALTLIDSHSHVAGEGQQIPTAGLNINAALSLNSNNLTDINDLILDSQSSDAGTNNTIYCKSGDLYFKDNAGNAVRITSGGAVDVGGVGGIGGDYTTTSATLFYTDASLTYFFQNSASAAAKIDVGEINATIINPTTRIDNADGTAGAPSYTFASDSDTGLFRSTDNTLNITTGGTEIVEFDGTSVDFTVPTIAPSFKWDTGSFIGTLSWTPTTTRTLTLPDANDTVVCRDTTDTMTNKTFADSTIHAQISTPSNPSSGFNKLYFKSDSKLYSLNSAGDENVIGGVATASDAGSITTYVPIIKDAIHSVSSGSYTILDNDGYHTILMSPGGTGYSVILPTAADNEGRSLTIKKVDSGAGAITVDGEGAETINGSTTYTLYSQYDYVTVYCNGTEWFIVSDLSSYTFSPTFDFNNTGPQNSIGALSVKVVRQGGSVTLNLLAGATGTITGSAPTVLESDTAIPSNFRPSSTRQFFIRATNNSTRYVATCQITSGGIIQIFPTISGGTFSGVSGFSDPFLVPSWTL